MSDELRQHHADGGGGGPDPTSGTPGPDWDRPDDDGRDDVADTIDPSSGTPGPDWDRPDGPGGDIDDPDQAGPGADID